MSSVIFNNTTPGAPDSYLWDFGDGVQSTQASPTHAYTNAGAYVVRLSAIKGGVSATVSRVVPVLAGGGSTTFTLLANNEGNILANNESTELAAVVG